MGASSTRATSSARTGISSIASIDLSESRKRRLLELRLLHQYITKTSLYCSVSPESDPVALEIWKTAILNAAFKNDALLYCLYALAALHIAKTEPYSQEMLEICGNYQVQALREHNNDVTNLNSANADAACLTSHYIHQAAFAMLQERELTPYTPPAQWLKKPPEPTQPQIMIQGIPTVKHSPRKPCRSSLHDQSPSRVSAPANNMSPSKEHMSHMSHMTQKCR